MVFRYTPGMYDNVFKCVLEGNLAWLEHMKFVNHQANTFFNPSEVTVVI